MEGAQSIGRRGDVFSTEPFESASWLDATFRLDEVLDGVLEGDGAFSCVIAGV